MTLNKKIVIGVLAVFLVFGSGQATNIDKWILLMIISGHAKISKG